MQIPRLEVVYQTLTKQQEIVNKHNQKIHLLKQRLGIKYLMNSSIKDKHDVRVESLNESIISMNLSKNVRAENDRLSDLKLKSIRDVLRDRKVATIVTGRPNRNGLNSEIVREKIIHAARQRAKRVLQTVPVVVPQAVVPQAVVSANVAAVRG